jgi:hypothetical protein
MICDPMVPLAQTAHLSCVKISTVSKRTQTSFDISPITKEYCHVRPKQFSEPMVCLVQIVHLYCTDTNTISKRTETRFHMMHSPWSSIRCAQDDFRAYGTFGTNRTPILCQDYHCLQMDSNKLSLGPRHLAVSSGASKMIYEPIVRSMQAVHLYCTDTHTASKRTETRFHMTHSPRSSIRIIQDDF